MKFIMNLFFTIFLVVILLSCNKVETITELEPDFQIEFKSQCGWCAGLEIITITSTKIEYLRHIPCGEDEGTKQKERAISSDEWNQISTSFDFEVFETLRYSECNICVDGCDEIISIIKDEKSHEISYSPNTNIKEIQQLQQLLSDLILEMAELD